MNIAPVLLRPKLPIFFTQWIFYVIQFIEGIDFCIVITQLTRS